LPLEVSGLHVRVVWGVELGQNPVHVDRPGDTAQIEMELADQAVHRGERRLLGHSLEISYLEYVGPYGRVRLVTGEIGKQQSEVVETRERATC
ncbi:MAG: hypothetical protein ACREM9_00860, partial [Gemmatimonadales bacterium]